MKTMRATKREYPWTKKFGDREITFRLLVPSDEQELKRAVLKFTNSLPASDLVFLRMDITQPEVIDEWLSNIKLGRTSTVIAEEHGEIVGYGNIHFSQAQWTNHIGEIRILVGDKIRGLGIGRTLANELGLIAKEQGLEKVVAHIPANQPRVRQMFVELGFEPAALLTDWLKDRNQRSHDLIIMARELA